MKNKISYLMIGLMMSIPPTALIPKQANAQILTLGVAEIAQLIQQIMQYSEAITQTETQIMSYVTQLKQLERMVQDGLAPIAYVWDQANTIINKIRNLDNTLSDYKRKFASLDGFLKKFGDVNFYRSSPCFNSGKCTAREIENLQNLDAMMSEYKKSSSDSLIKLIDSQQMQLTADARQLETLQRQATTAQGQMEAIQYGTMMQSQIANQLLQLRAMQLSQAQLNAAAQKALDDEKARQVAASQDLRKGTEKEVKSKDLNWKP